jgi:riboflavin kinase/FMN adenylyltransferase
MTGGSMDTVQGVDGLRPEHGRLFVVIGVFDGLHRGHAYLLEHLRIEAERRDARPTVITFDHHPDEVIQGVAPPLLLHPAERLERLAAAGVQVTVVQHFDETVRRTAYDDFVGMITRRVDLAGFLMTPDAAFGFERRGTPEAVAELGARGGFDVVVVPPYTLDGQPVRSSDIRAAIAAGDLGRARKLLGRDVTITGNPRPNGEALHLEFDMPVALPPPGTYGGSVNGQNVTLEIDTTGAVTVRPGIGDLDSAQLTVTIR